MATTGQEIDTKVKGFLASKTIWGILILLSPAISAMLGFDVSKEIGDSYELIIEVIGTVLGLYGRWKANSSIVISKYKK